MIRLLLWAYRTRRRLDREGRLLPGWDTDRGHRVMSTMLREYRSETHAAD